VDNYLPKHAIDRTTFRMAELLKARWGTQHDQQPIETTQKAADEGAEQ
jgi:hypothetical protein